MPNTSQDLAAQISKGTLSLSELEGCDAELTTNQNPLVIKYSQLFLVRRDKVAKSPYLSYSPFLDVSKFNDARRKSVADSMAANILDSIPARKEIENLLIPDPDKKDRALEKKNILLQGNAISPSQAISAIEIHSAYRKYIAQKIENGARPLHSLFSAILNISRQDFIEETKLSAAIASGLLDPFYSSSPAKYKFAIFGQYEQEWKPAGYSRGDLIKSLSLCPGETVTLEYHYWDKAIIKNEQELSSELELKSSSTLTQRDSKELLDELTKTNQVKLDGNAKVTIPLPPVDISGGDAASLSSQVQPHVTNSVKSSIENVVSTSNDFKQTRKVRIEETRDTGRENKQTRVVANTNRCHTLEFRYFEILSNYLVTSSCVGFQVCLLVPYTVVCEGKTLSPKGINAAFLLCNEPVLKSVLIDAKFAAGFEAARTVESFKKLKRLFAENVALQETGGNSVAGSSSSTSAQAIENEYRDLRNSIITAYNLLNAAASDVANAFEIVDLGNILTDIGGIISRDVTAIRRFPAWVALNLDSDTFHAIETLRTTNKPARQAIRDFFAKVSENDFQFLNPVTGDVADALEELGVPFSDQIAGAIFDFGIIGLVGNIVKDDAGLHDAVQAAESFFNTTDKTPAGRVTTPLAGPDGSTPIPIPPPSVTDFVSIVDVANALVELERLICHIQCNFEYYKEALWLSKGPDYRSDFLEKAGVRQFVSNEVAGFADHCVAFPIVDSSFLKKELDVQRLLTLLSGLKQKDVSELVTLPTSSTILRGQLGDCDLCEDYILKSRDADVRQQNAKAALDEAESAHKAAKTKVVEQEAKRVAARLASQPPDLSDPIEHSDAKLDIHVITPDPNP